MADLATIWNLALLHVGQNETVADPDGEQSTVAKTLRRVYPHARDNLLAEMPWLFAERTVAATPDAEAAPYPWAYAYLLPADALRVWRVIPAGGLTDPPVPFQVGGATSTAGVDRGLVLTNEPLAWLVHARRVEDVTRYPAHFVDALSWRLAFEIAMPLSNRTEIRQEAWQLYQRRLDAAAVVEASQRRAAPPRNAFVEARA